MSLPPLRFLLRSFRFSSSARWISRCRAAVAVAELFVAAAAGDTVAVLLFGPLFRHAAVAVTELFVLEMLLFLLSSFFPQVIGLRW